MSKFVSKHGMIKVYGLAVPNAVWNHFPDLSRGELAWDSSEVQGYLDARSLWVPRFAVEVVSLARESHERAEITRAFPVQIGTRRGSVRVYGASLDEVLEWIGG